MSSANDSLIQLEGSEQPRLHSFGDLLGHSPDGEMAHFGSAAVDIDMLEKEIAAKEEARRERAELSGTIGGMAAQPRPARRGPMQEVDLDAELDTLDEPVWDTVKRDLITVGSKFGHVIFPSADRQQLLKDWDLWGPLFICVALALILQSGGDGMTSPEFTQVFSLTFFGSCIVTLNIKLLGGQISFFQSLCVIGYCLLPPAMASVACKFILTGTSKFWFVLRLIATSAGFVWSTIAAMGFLAGCQPSEKRRLLVIYPIFLFYFVISWMILSHS